MIGKSYNEINIGDSASFTKTISETDVYLFAGISGDLNPAHINETYAQGTFFKGRIAHGILCSSLISTVMGMQLPGPGTIYLRQELNFTAPVRIGDTITARVEVIEKLEKNKLRMRTTCTNQNGVVVIDGEALMSPPKK